MSSYLSHKKNVITSVDEFDYLERLKPSAIMEYFQDLATLHASEIGIGFEEMKSRNLCWVLNRLSAEIELYPEVGQEIVITTFPHKPSIVDAVRDYYITDIHGKNLIRGTSRWCVLDTNSKAVRRCSPLFSYDDSRYNPEFALENGNIQLPELETIDCKSESTYSSAVRITDLDRNGHVNNARYADIVLNSCDFDYYSTHSIRAFDFNFLCEMKIGNEYTVSVKTVNDASYFEASGNTRVNPIFRARILWR